MKKNIQLILVLFFVVSCTSATTPQKKVKIAQAIKKEGDVYQAQGDYTTALAKLLEAEKLVPSDPYIQNSLGLAYMGKKRYELAENAFQKALSKKPDYTEAINNLGAAFLRQKEWDTAIKQFQLVLDDLIYPTPHFPLTNIGWAYLGKQNFPQAQSYFLKALEEEPRFLTASHGLAQVYLRTGQYDRAMTFLHKKIRRSPDAAILHADIAQAYEAKGRIKQAIKAWQLVLRLVPENSSLARKADDHIVRLQ